MSSMFIADRGVNLWGMGDVSLPDFGPGKIEYTIPALGLDFNYSLLC